MSPGFHPNFPFETLLQWTRPNHHKSCQSFPFWRNFSIVIQTSSRPASSQKPISIHWWSQQRSSNFKPQLLEKVVASRIQSHLSSNSLSSSFQSAYRIFHSTETTLLEIHNDLILAMDRGTWGTSLILLDLSAAFDTRSFHPSYSSSKLVRSWWSVSWLVLILSLTSLSGSLNQWLHLCILYCFLWCTPRFRTWPTPFHSLYNSSWLGDLKKNPSNIICTLMTLSCTSLSLLQILLYRLKHLPPLSMIFSHGWTWTSCFSIHRKLNFFSLAQNNSVSNFLI